MSKKSNTDPDFEETLAELEKLVTNLEEGELTLDESLSGFKQGIELTRQCQAVLDNAQQTVEKLTNNEDEDSLEPFNPND
jgi:exodeoxyribonuclease VII small subunit